MKIPLIRLDEPSNYILILLRQLFIVLYVLITIIYQQYNVNRGILFEINVFNSSKVQIRIYDPIVNQNLAMGEILHWRKFCKNEKPDEKIVMKKC